MPAVAVGRVGRGRLRMESIAQLEGFLSRFLLLIPRLTGILVVSPFFSARFVWSVKVYLVLILAMVLAPVISFPGHFPADVVSLVILAVQEFGIGFCIGFSALLVFSAMQVAGQLIDMSIGFGIVEVIDPQYGIQVPLMGSFLYLLALMLFVMLDGHHSVLAALVRSYEFIPIGGGTLRPGLPELVTALFSGMFLTAVEMSLPVIGVLLIVDVVMGILARTMPQMNVFVVGLPLKVVVGVSILAVASPAFGVVSKYLVDGALEAMEKVVLSLGS